MKVIASNGYRPGSGKSGRDLVSLDNAVEVDFEPCQCHTGYYQFC